MLMQTKISFATPQVNVDALVDELVERFLGYWWRAGNSTPNLSATYSLHEKLQREKILSATVDGLLADFKHIETSPDGRQAQRQRIEERVIAFAHSGLDLDPQALHAFLGAGFREAAFDFARRARAFDPEISTQDVYQAGRNAWSMNLFQYLFGLPVRLTPSIFAYSLLYPYTDNYLDDPRLPIEVKKRANQRLTLRLTGKKMLPDNTHEQHIFDLIEMIEGEYDRAQYPQVYQSLLAIQKAQVESLCLFQAGASPYEVDTLRLCFKKGGAATLADGYLVAGTLTPAQEEFAFGYGAFTQLLDDQEDLLADRQAGLMTVFSQTSYGWRLDGILNRVFAFQDLALSGLRQMEPPGGAPVTGMILRGIELLLIEGAGKNARFHSPHYLRALEAGLPFRFSELNRQMRRLAQLGRSADRLTALFLEA